MKSIVSILMFLSILVVGIVQEKKAAHIKTGTLSFIDFDAENEGFEILTHIDILPNTTLHFTDSEWNGNRFGTDESNLIWNSGKKTITAGSYIEFTTLGSNPKVSFGSLQGTMRLSKKGEAIFAYQGAERLPQTFIAAIANHKEAFGTLINTGLDQTSSVVTTIETKLQVDY